MEAIVEQRSPGLEVGKGEAVDDTNEEGTSANDDAEEEVAVPDAACGFLPFSQVIL